MGRSFLSTGVLFDDRQHVIMEVIPSGVWDFVNTGTEPLPKRCALIHRRWLQGFHLQSETYKKYISYQEYNVISCNINCVHLPPPRIIYVSTHTFLATTSDGLGLDKNSSSASSTLRDLFGPRCEDGRPLLWGILTPVAEAGSSSVSPSTSGSSSLSDALAGSWRHNMVLIGNHAIIKCFTSYQ